MTSHITQFIVDGADYFSAHTDAGSVRIGNVGGFIIEFPRSHPAYNRCVSVADELAVESLVDEFAITHMQSSIRH